MKISAGGRKVQLGFASPLKNPAAPTLAAPKCESEWVMLAQPDPRELVALGSQRYQKGVNQQSTWQSGDGDTERGGAEVRKKLSRE